MRAPAALVWFRHDLRLADNAALRAAIDQGGAVIPVYIWAPEEDGAWSPGAASRWWLHQSLARLDTDLRKRGTRLIVRRGPGLRALRALARESGATTIAWNRRYEPAAIAREAEVAAALRADGLTVRTFNSGLLFEPSEVRTQAGNPFQVFTAFWKACRQLPAPTVPQGAPRRVRGPEHWPSGLEIDALRLLPQIDWASGLRAAWQPGEAGAHLQLEHFLDGRLRSYVEDRDRPDRLGSSRLSPHLHFGELSPRQIWHAVESRAAGDRKPGLFAGADAFLRELGWREFAHHVLFHFPHTPDAPLRPAFARFPWRDDPQALQAWRRGRTGYPIVDAGMRELWATGWMHNRVRMIVASFLVKDLLLPWQAGAQWFWDTLVDADLANNTLGWQWSAGCGADAAPYFRIFNPTRQGEQFDPQGEYVRRWVPELERLPAHWIHHPWDAPDSVRREAAVTLGKSYPLRIIDHVVARQRALAALARIRTSEPPPRTTTRS